MPASHALGLSPKAYVLPLPLPLLLLPQSTRVCALQSVDAVVGHQLGCFTSLALAGIMGARLAKTRKVRTRRGDSLGDVTPGSLRAL